MRLIMHILAAALVLGLAFAGHVRAQVFPLDHELSPEMTAGCRTDVTPPVSRTQPLPGAVKILPPAQGAYFGAYQIPTSPSDVSRFASATGRTPPVVFTMHDFFAETNGSTTPDRDLGTIMEGGGSRVRPLELAGWLTDRGSVLALSWSIYCCDIENMLFWARLKRPHSHFNALLAGEHDAFIRANARRIKAHGKPIMITLVPEFNWQGMFLFGANGRTWIDGADHICTQYGDPTWPDGPERVRDVFIRIIDIFREEGVRNVTWFMYASNNFMVPGDEGQSRWLHPKYFYPGDDYIDWVGQSVYYTAPEWVADFEDVATFEQVFLPGYQAWRDVTKRPLLLAEFGIVAEQGADRRGLWQDLLTRYIKELGGIGALAVADTELFRDYFDIPMLSTHTAEAALVRQLTEQDAFYRAPIAVGSATAPRTVAD